MVNIQISLTAKNDLEELSEDVQERIKGKLLNDVKDDPERHLRPMCNTDAESIRVGDYRILADYRNDEERLKILAIGHRRNIYDREL